MSESDMVMGEYLRPAYLHVKNKLGYGTRGVLIGAYNGVAAEFVYNGLKPSAFYLLDPYVPYRDDTYVQSNWDKAYISLVSKFKDKKDVIILKRKSEDIYSAFPDEYFDFVYHDGDHKYDHMMMDLETWWPKIKVGGVIGGHDYNDGLGVAQAAKDFSSKMGLPFEHSLDMVIGKDSIEDWWMDKV